MGEKKYFYFCSMPGKSNDTNIYTWSISFLATEEKIINFYGIHDCLFSVKVKILA